MSTTESQLRDEFLAALSANSARLEVALRAELSRPIKPEEDDAVYFEIQMDGYEVQCCDTKAVVLPDYWLKESLPDDWFDRAYDTEADLHKLITVPLFDWFAEQWAKAGGPANHNQAYMFYHGYNHEQFDLHERRWLPPGKPFGEWLASQ